VALVRRSALSREDYEEERRDVARLREAGCAGIVMNPMVRLRDQLRSDYLKREHRNYPIVLLDMAFPEQERSQVVFDNYASGLEMTEWLLQAEGHRRIAFMDWKVPQGELMSRSMRDRYQGYLAALRKAGVAPLAEDRWTVTYPSMGGDPRDDARAHLRKWRESTDRPTALVTLNDGWAMEMKGQASDLGIAAPQDIRLTGFDNCPMIASMRPGFPTSNPDFEKAGETAVHLLLQHISGALDAPVHYMQPAPFLLRDAIAMRRPVSAATL
jgi:LacI family transcriptional regulator, xylobiose transport system transcriptional regulator